VARTRFAPDRGLTTRMLATMILLAVLYVVLVAAISGTDRGGFMGLPFLFAEGRGRPGEISREQLSLAASQADQQYPHHHFVDHVIQEITPQGQVAWEWTTSEHIPVTETPPAWRNEARNVSTSGSWPAAIKALSTPNFADLDRHVYELRQPSGERIEGGKLRRGVPGVNSREA
jgi:hypothetical protein